MAEKSQEWSPYGLEAIRQAHLRRRRIVAALVILGILLVGMTLFQTQKRSSLSLSVNGREVGNGIEIDTGPDEKPKDYVTVSLTPGRVAHLEAGGGAPPPQVQQNSLQDTSRAKPLPWRLWLVNAAPWLFAGAAAFFLAKRRGKHDEVNYGIFKGAMPLEMLTAHQSQAVFTRRWAKTSVFGKSRTDHVPGDVERVPQEDG